MKLSVLAFAVFSTIWIWQPAKAETLTQQAYDAKIQQYTDIVNQTKSILEEHSAQADGAVQSQAFCDRLNAYEQIAKLSQENIQLELAPVMLMAAQRYLDRQQASLTKSGMTSAVFCAGKTSK